MITEELRLSLEEYLTENYIETSVQLIHRHMYLNVFMSIADTH